MEKSRISEAKIGANVKIKCENRTIYISAVH